MLPPRRSRRYEVVAAPGSLPLAATARAG
jgi:hypothetical protein